LSIDAIRRSLAYALKLKNGQRREFGNTEIRKMVLRAATLSDAVGTQEA
jgi:hypothetical protein